MFDVLEDVHRVVLSVKDLSHDLHVAFGDVILVPKCF